MKRVLLVLLVLLVAIPLAAFAAARILLDGDAIRTRIAAAVQRATGRDLVIAGPVQLAWSLTPTIEARDVSLANPPGMSRPALAHVDRVEAQVALLPLLSRRVEIRQIRLAAPDVQLERDAQGRPNWVFTRPEPPPGPPPAAPSTERRFEVAVGAVDINDARITWSGGAAPVRLTAPRIVYAPDTGRLDGELVLNGTSFALTGAAGPIEGAAWPLNVHLVGGGLAATAAGTTAQAALEVLAPDLAAASTIAGRPLPALHDARLTATLSPAGVAGLRLQAASLDLGAVRLRNLNAAAPGMADPVSATAELQAGNLSAALAANAGSLGALLGHGPIPFQALAIAGDASVSAQGTAADLRGNGLDAALSAKIPDLARLGALAGVAVPPLRDLALDARAIAAPNGFGLRGLHLTSQAGDLAGDVTIGLAPRPSVRGSLVAHRLDIDGWTPRPPPAPAAPAAPPAPAPASAPPPTPDRLIPDLKLPFAALRQADADVHASIGEAVWRGVAYHAVDARLLLQDGRLRLDPVSMQGPGGTMHGQLLADASAQPPTASLTAQAPGLAAGPLLALFGAPDTTRGTIDLDLQLQGSGDGLRALAATLGGHAGLAMVDGEVDNHWLEGLFAATLRAANLPLETGGTSRVRCLAVRADAASGQVQLHALSLDTSRLKLDGEGALNLGSETLDLHIRPQLRLGAGLSIPIRVTGGFRGPKVALDPGAIAPGRVGITLGGPAPADTCGPALALARNGHPGAAPPAPEATKPARPADLLRGLFR